MSPWIRLGGRIARRVVPKPYVIVHGYYGKGNVGDEAILAATLQTVRERTSGTPLVFAWDAARVRADFGVESLDPRRSPRAAYRAIVQARAFLLGGGGLIKDYGAGSQSLFRWMQWIDLARRLGAGTMTWSVGVDEVVHAASEARIREVLGAVDVVTVRDELSADRLRALGLTREIAVTADPVVPLATSWRSRRETADRLRVVVAPRALYTAASEVTHPARFEALLGAFAEVLDHLQEAHDARVTCIALRTRPGDDDREVCREIAARMQGGSRVEIVDDEDPTTHDILGRLCHADLQIGMRLHATVMAVGLGVPSLAVAYMPKVRGFMASLGQQAFCAAPEAATGAWMIDRAEAALAERDRLGAALQRHTDRMAAAYAENGTFLDRLVEAA
ncbi:MAG: polysaccharide pyruvyl transferase family protein [Bacteroidota bacterium]